MINTIRINNTNGVRHFGVIISNEIFFINHIASMASKSRQLIGRILRTFVTRETVIIMTLLQNLVLSRLKYCSQPWSLNLSGLIEETGGLQRRFTSKLTSVKRLNYWECSKVMRLCALKRWRNIHTIIYDGKSWRSMFQTSAHKRKF